MTIKWSNYLSTCRLKDVAERISRHGYNSPPALNALRNATVTQVAIGANHIAFLLEVSFGFDVFCVGNLSLSQQGVGVSFGHPTPQKSPCRQGLGQDFHNRVSKMGFQEDRVSKPPHLKKQSHHTLTDHIH